MQRPAHSILFSAVSRSLAYLLNKAVPTLDCSKSLKMEHSLMDLAKVTDLIERSGVIFSRTFAYFLFKSRPLAT